MTETPGFDDFTASIVSPMQELNDHRLQAPLPAREGTSPSAARRSSTRRGTADSLAVPRPDLLSADNLFFGITSRDFDENAIADDDGASINARDFHRGSAAGVTPRRSTFKRPDEHASRSRRSSSSSRSISPPNSVDAFAGPRRGRAGTANSIAPSFIGSLRRTASGEPIRRRGTFSDSKSEHAQSPHASSRGSVEDDVCFPPEEEPNQPYAIDFDDLQEFVMKKRAKTPVLHPLHHKRSFTCKDNKKRVFEDLRNPNSQPIPFIKVTSQGQSSVSEPVVGDESSSEFDEKYAARRGSVTDLEPIDFSTTAALPSNRWSFFSSELEDSIHAPELGDLLMPGETFKHLFHLGPQGGCWWLDMLMPSEEEVEVICKAFGIHGLTREDIIEQETREKVELFKSYYFVCFRSFYQMDKDSEYYMEPVNVYAVVFREGILTFTFAPSPHAGNVRKRMGKLRDYVALGADWICYALIDDIVDTFGPVIRGVEHEVETIEDNVFTARAEDMRTLLHQMGDSRKKVISLTRLLGGKADVIRGFAKRCNEQYSITPRQDVGMYLSDIQDHVVTMTSNLTHFEKMLSRAHSNYLAQISVDNIAQGNKANKVLSKVTFIATVLVPLNLVCGLFGMNVPVPGRSSDNLGWFFGIVGCLLLFVVISCIVARRFRFI